MVSSLNPGGAASTSTSVKKPYLYSCLTRPSMVSVAVLMKNCWSDYALNRRVGSAKRRAGSTGSLVPRRAAGAEPANGQVHLHGLEPSWHRHLRPLPGQVNVVNRPAGLAVKVAMLMHVGTKTRGAPVQVYLLHQAAPHQCVQAVVDRRHRNVRHHVLGPQEDLLRRRMIPLLQQHVIHPTAEQARSEEHASEPQ